MTKTLVVVACLALGCGDVNGQNKIVRMGASDLGASFNATRLGDRVVTRPGRMTLANVTSISPVCAYTGGYVDITTKLTDGDVSTSHHFQAAGAGVGIEISLAFQQPITSLTLSLSAVNAALSHLLIRHQTSTALLTATITSDNTSVGGVTLARSGTVTFTLASQQRTTRTFAAGSTPIGPYYWYYLALVPEGGAWPSADIMEASVPAPAQITGLASSGTEATLIGAEQDDGATLGILSAAVTTMRSFALPSLNLGYASAAWRFFSWTTKAVAFNGYGSPVYIDGNTARPLRAVPGSDADTRIYLNALPVTDNLTPYRNRLYGSKGNVVAFSELDNADNVIPTDGTAPLGGANLWPADNNFSVGSGGEVNAMTVFRDRLVIHAGGDVWSYDQNSLHLMEPGTGTVATNSVATLPFGVVWLASDGVRLFDGQSSASISARDGQVTSIIDVHLNRGNFGKAVGVHLPRKHQYRLYVPVNGSPRNRLCLVWDYSHGLQEARWYVWGGTPYWLEPSATYHELEVSAAAVVNAGTDDELLVTGDYDGNLWIEDRGYSDAGYPIYFAAMFKDVGDDEGLKTYRDIRIDAEASGATLKLAMLPDGESFPAGIGSTTYTPGYRAQSISTLLAGQTTWKVNTSPAFRASGANFGPVRTTSHYRIGNRGLSHTVSPVIYSDGTDVNAVRIGGRVSIQNVEIEYRPRVGRRGGAGGSPLPGTNPLDGGGLYS